MQVAQTHTFLFDVSTNTRALVMSRTTLAKARFRRPTFRIDLALMKETKQKRRECFQPSSTATSPSSSGGKLQARRSGA